MSDHLATVATALGAPVEIVQRSADARARADGTTAEAVLAAWSGGETPPAAAAPEPVAATPEPAAASDTQADAIPDDADALEREADEPAPTPPPAKVAKAPVPTEAVAVFGPGGEINWEAASVLAGMPAKLLQRSTEAKAKAEGRASAEILADTVGKDAEAQMPSKTPKADTGAGSAPAAAPPPPADPKPVPASGSERFESAEEAAAAGAIPRWLAAAFVIIPTIAVLYALFLPNGPNCGDAGSLAIDPVTGVAVNCDFTPYGVETVDYYAMGQGEYTACAACHGENGGGAGNFPAFVGGSLLEAFPEGSCQVQVDWVSVGTTGWPDPTYGANAKPVGGSGAVMPAFGNTLSQEELRAVVLYERVRFGGQDLEAALLDCGLAGTEEAGG